MKSRLLIKEGNNENCEHNFKTISESNYYMIKIVKCKCEKCLRVEEYSIKK